MGKPSNDSDNPPLTKQKTFEVFKA